MRMLRIIMCVYIRMRSIPSKRVDSAICLPASKNSAEGFAL